MVFCKKEYLNNLHVHNLELHALSYFYNFILLERFFWCSCSVAILLAVEGCRSLKVGTSNSVG